MVPSHLFISFLVVLFDPASAQIGDKCILKSTNQEGECKLNCPSAIEQAKKGIEITQCGFYALTTPILCCEIPVANENTFVQSLDHRQEEDVYVSANENTFLPSGDIVFENGPVASTNTDERISEQKCEEYSKEITNVVQVTPLILPSYPINITVDKCDYNSNPLIVGGKPARPGEFPFMAAIGFDTEEDKWRCGGTLISEWFVLTAAHCTHTLEPPTVIRLGDLVLSSTNDGSIHQDYRIANIYNHPKYKHPFKYHDIALIKTATQVRFTNFTRPACLYTKITINRNVALATGWGKTGFASDPSDKLMKVSLNIYSNQICEKRYKNNAETLPRGIHSSMLCAGVLDGKMDTCQGDSGGPLIITEEKNHCKFYVIGITSFGKSCAQVNTPAIYTKVSDYVEWIEKIVW